jgi:stage II sporulation protein Q
VKNKFIEVVFKKFQSYSFIIFLALILGAFFALAQLNNKPTDKDGDKDPVVVNPGEDEKPGGDTPVVVKPEDELFAKPVSDNMVIFRDYFTAELTGAAREAAIIRLADDSTMINRSLVYTAEDKEAKFNVTAALSGKVTRSESTELYGYLVEVEHVNGIKTVYRSLSEVTVKVGDTIKQGAVLGKAGECLLDSEAGVHLEFQVLDAQGFKMNPNELIDNKMKASEIE